MIVIAGIIEVADDQREEVLECLRRLKATSLKMDEGVVAYRIGTDIGNPNQIHIYEEWESTETLKAHGQKPHMDEFRELRKRLQLTTTGFSRWRCEELGQF